MKSSAQPSPEHPQQTDRETPPAKRHRTLPLDPNLSQPQTPLQIVPIEVIDLDADDNPTPPVAANQTAPTSVEVVLIDDEDDDVIDLDRLNPQRQIPPPPPPQPTRLQTYPRSSTASTLAPLLPQSQPRLHPQMTMYPPLAPDFLTSAAPPTPTPHNPPTAPAQTQSYPPMTLPIPHANAQPAPIVIPNPAPSTAANRLHVTNSGGLFRVHSDTIEIIDSDDEEQLVQNKRIVSTQNGLHVLQTSQPFSSNSAPTIPSAPTFIAHPPSAPTFIAHPQVPQLPPSHFAHHPFPTAPALPHHASNPLIPMPGERYPRSVAVAAAAVAAASYHQAPRAVQQQPPPYVPPPTFPPPLGPAPLPSAGAKGGLTEEGFRTLVKQNDLTAEADKEAKTPCEMTIELMPHQKRALEWMTKRERPMDLDEEIVAADDECLGGILADEQGLGKTLTMIAVMLKNQPMPRQTNDTPALDTPSSSSDSEFDSEPESIRHNEKSSWKTLVVCPLSLLHQWYDEIVTNIRKGDKPAVLIYHGPKRERKVANLKRYDVVITTYATLQNEYPKELKNLPENRLRKEANLKLVRRQEGPLFSLHWRRVVLDEAHHVKNRNTENWAAVMSVQADVRWCLTGTPITNSVDDIYSLFCFVRYRFVPTHELWNRLWKKKLEHYSPLVRGPAFKRFQAICGVVVLRRTKKDKINGKPLLSLPDKNIQIVECDFIDKEEQAVYQAVQEKSILTVNKYLMGGTTGLNYSSMLVLLLRLRQACCHPFLVQYSQMQGSGTMEEESAGKYATPYSREELGEAMELVEGQQSMMMMLDESVRERVERNLRPPEKRPGIHWGFFKCLVCLKEEPWKQGVVFGCGDMLCDGCSQQARVQRRCLQCGNSVGTGAEADVELNANELRMEVHGKTILGTSVLRGLRVTGREIKAWVKEELEKRKLEGRGTGVSAEQTQTRSSNRSGDVTEEDNDEGTVVGVGSTGGSLIGKEVQATVQEDRNASSPLEEGKKKLLGAFSQHSTKIQMIVNELNRVREQGDSEKTLIFSQWTTMLDMIQFHVELNGHETCRLDGTMKIVERGRQIDEFKRSKEKHVLLISLHSGGTGLNLTAACRVILADVWWNPCVEEQAIDRVHRIGQDKTVYVTRYKMKGTVEERIYAICKAKRAKVAGALGESSSVSLGRQKMSMAQLLSLFSETAGAVVSRAAPGSATAEAAENITNFINQRQSNGL